MGDFGQKMGELAVIAGVRSATCVTKTLVCAPSKEKPLLARWVFAFAPQERGAYVPEFLCRFCELGLYGIKPC